MLAALVPTAVTVIAAAAPDDEDVVAGWTAFALFIGLIVAVALLGVSLTRRLKNVERAAEEGKYDPSTPRRRPARGLAAARELREQQADDSEPPAER